jgi:hypothetical protein
MVKERFYYLIDNERQIGPFNLEELKSKRIQESTMVWTEGLDDWVRAAEVLELSEIVIAEPPLYSNSKSQTSIITNHGTVKFKESLPERPKLETTQKSYPEFTVIGLLLIGIVAIGYFLMMKRVSEGETLPDYFNANRDVRLTLLIVQFAFRVGTAYAISDVLEKLNRQSCLLTFAGFMFPILTLIITGQLKKKPLELNLDSSKTIPEKVQELRKKAEMLESSGLKAESYEIYGAILNLNPNDKHANQRQQELKSESQKSHKQAKDSSKREEDIQLTKREKNDAFKIAILFIALVAIVWIISVLVRFFE